MEIVPGGCYLYSDSGLHRTVLQRIPGNHPSFQDVNVAKNVDFYPKVRHPHLEMVEHWTIPNWRDILELATFLHVLHYTPYKEGLQIVFLI